MLLSSHSKTGRIVAVSGARKELESRVPHSFAFFANEWVLRVRGTLARVRYPNVATGRALISSGHSWNFTLTSPASW